MKDLKQELIESINNLSIIEDKIVYFVSRLNELDLRIQEILHYYEYNNITTNGHQAISRELQRLQKERRNVKNLYEIFGIYQTNKNKLMESNNRQLLISDICKKEKSLDTKYMNKYYTIEELNKLAKKE